MVPPCFAAPLQARPCALADASICAVTGAPGAGLAHSASPAQLRGHLPPRACLPGSIVRAFCQAHSGRTLLIQAVCFLPKGIHTPCSYYNTQKQRICQPGNWLVLPVSVLALSVTCGDSSGLRAAGSPSQSPAVTALPKGEPIAAHGQRVLPQGFHLISLLRRQLSSLYRLRDISLRPEGVFPQGEAFGGSRSGPSFVQPLSHLR